MKLSDVVGMRPTLEKIAGKEMDGAAALEFAMFVRSILEEIQKFEVKRAELFQKYGEEVKTEDDKTGIKIKPENEKTFNNAIKKALGKKISVEPFDIATLGIKISPAELVNSLLIFK